MALVYLFLGSDLTIDRNTELSKRIQSTKWFDSIVFDRSSLSEITIFDFDLTNQDFAFHLSTSSDKTDNRSRSWLIWPRWNHRSLRALSCNRSKNLLCPLMKLINKIANFVLIFRLKEKEKECSCRKTIFKRYYRYAWKERKINIHHIDNCCTWTTR